MASVSDQNYLNDIFEKIDNDYQFFMQCLHEVLNEIGDEELADFVERLEEEPAEASKVKQVDPSREMHVLSVVFQLLNLVEENASAQMRRVREAQGNGSKEPGLWLQNIKQLLSGGFEAQEIADAISRVEVEPVLTAHPTEAKRPTILHIHRALYLYLVQLENQMWTPTEREDIKSSIKAHLERLLRTGEVLYKKPDVISEIENVLHYLKEVFPQVLEKLDLRLRDSWAASGLDPLYINDPKAFPELKFGSWVGGDRDGHPLVTAPLTRKTLRMLRKTALDVIFEQLQLLYHRLSLSSELQNPSWELITRIDQLKDSVGTPDDEPFHRSPPEHWRQFVSLVMRKLCNTKKFEPNGYTSPQELSEDLEILRRSLESVGAERLAKHDLFPVERAVHVFGFHMARLDIRQNSHMHDLAVGQLLEEAGFEDHDFVNWDEEKRQKFLLKELESPRPFTSGRTALKDEAETVLSCYRALVEHIDKCGKEGLGSLIISMTRSLSDLLVVYLLAREVGLVTRTGTQCGCILPIVPLFETVDDLKRAPNILREFIRHPMTQESYRIRFAAARPVQQVMVGYSDSSKDGGYLASQWNLNRAQDAMAKVVEQEGVNISFFHGRGGTPSRGAGPTHRFLEALPHGSLKGVFRMTEQGETIAQKYANQITATYNLELLIAGVTATTLKHSKKVEEDTRFNDIMDRLSELSKDSYVDLLESDGFIEYWAEATPIDVLEESAIGSRPAKRRKGTRSIENIRAIPWVFSWNQARHYLPGWYGIGTALKTLQDESAEDFEYLKEYAFERPILRNSLYNVETSIASADPDLMTRYASLVNKAETRNRILSRILDEHSLTQEMIDTIFQSPRDERRPRMIKTLQLREAGLKKLHLQQIEFLRQWRTASSYHDDSAHTREYLIPLLISVNAIAAGLRVTG